MKVRSGSALSFEPASHEDRQSPGVFKKIMAIKEDFIPGRAQMINWALLPAGRSFRAHYHEDMQEIFVMLSGRVEMRCAGQSAVLERGDAVLIDPGEVHAMRNLCGEDVEYVVMGIALGTGGKTVVV